MLGLASSASAATNVVPNPSFEQGCGSSPVVPCHWNDPGPFVTIAQDTSVFRTGSASLKFTLSGGTFDSDISDCVNASAAAGSYNPTVYYLTNDANAGLLEAGYVFFPGPNCTGGGTERDLSGSAEPDGNWHLVGAQTLMFPTAAVSMRFTVAVGTSTAGSAPVVYFDDDDFEGTPLAVTLSSFRAVRSHRGVALRWRTGTEADTLGFNVFRQQGGKRVRVNRRLLPAVGRVTGSSYSFLDRRAPRRAVRYWLQDVSTRGVRTWHGPVRARAA